MRIGVAGVYIALLFVAAARAEFVGGVESFDGTTPDTATWVAGTNTTIQQNNSLRISGVGGYSAQAFTLGVGQGVQAKLTLWALPVSPPPNEHKTAAFYLTSRSAGMTSNYFSDSRWAGIRASFNSPFTDTRFYYVEGSNNQENFNTFATLSGDHSPDLFNLEILRLDTTLFKMSVRDAVGSLLGSVTRDISVPEAEWQPVHGTVPDNLYIHLTASGRWDDITIVSVPEPIGIGAFSIASLLLLRRRRCC